MKNGLSIYKSWQRILQYLNAYPNYISQMLLPRTSWDIWGLSLKNSPVTTLLRCVNYDNIRKLKISSVISGSIARQGLLCTYASTFTPARTFFFRPGAARKRLQAFYQGLS